MQKNKDDIQLFHFWSKILPCKYLSITILICLLNGNNYIAKMDRYVCSIIMIPLLIIIHNTDFAHITFNYRPGNIEKFRNIVTSRAYFRVFLTSICGLGNPKCDLANLIVVNFPLLHASCFIDLFLCLRLCMLYVNFENGTACFSMLN